MLRGNAEILLFVTIEIKWEEASTLKIKTLLEYVLPHLLAFTYCPLLICGSGKNELLTSLNYVATFWLQHVDVAEGRPVVQDTLTKHGKLGTPHQIIGVVGMPQPVGPAAASGRGVEDVV
ncbi:MAG: hypothetical protein M1816_001413 [Peltula sp. TS41687]|nr:MAG: hypothetical protein M1816_001413 [Peltula sp. TS41687]